MEYDGCFYVDPPHNVINVLENLKVSWVTFSNQLLELTSLSSLDSCIDQTLSASHSVEEELGWSQASQVGVLNEASALRTVIILNEVRQCAVFEAKGNSLTLHVLLPHHSNNLNRGEWMLKSRYFILTYHLLEGNDGETRTWEMLIFDPLEPATTMDLKLLYSDRDF